MISYGFSSPSSTPDLKRMLEELVLKEGFSWIEVGAWEAENSPLLSALARFRKDHELNLSVHLRFVDVNPSSVVTEIRDASISVLRKDLAFAQSLSAQRVVMHGGDIGWFDFLPKDSPCYEDSMSMINNMRKDHFRVLSDSLTLLADEADRLGIELLLENMYFPWELPNTPQEMASMLRNELGGRIGMTLDFGHSLVSGFDPTTYVDSLGELIRHTHIHDNDGKFDTHLPLGHGSLSLRPSIPALVGCNGDVTLLLELPLRRIEDFIEGKHLLQDAAGSPL